jgi:RND family efflux transporter MFP subunit
MAGTLRDDLASLRIERNGSNGQVHRSASRRSGREGGIGILALLLWMIPLGLIAVAGTYAYRQYEQIRSKPEVSVGLVQNMTSGEAEKLLSAKGYLKSRYQAMIGATVPGRVERMYVEEGAKVKKGQVLAVLEHHDLDALLSSRQAQLQKAEAEVLEARVDLKEKEREARRATRLYAQKTVSVEEVEKAKATRDMASARVVALEASLKLMAASVQETEETIRKMSLYAPFDGTVVEKQGEEGEVISPSAMSTATGRSAVVTLADLSTMDVETDIAENLLSRVGIGQPAEISVSAVPSKHYRGQLRQIIPMGDRGRGTVKVKVAILDPDAYLFPELVATVHFLPDKVRINPDATKAYLFVPTEAVFEENGHSYVWVVDSKPSVRKRHVEVAVTKDELARVESGLKAGEQVVVNPPKTLHDNEVVKVAE